MPLNNLVIIAAAGSGKTTRIVHDALKNPSHKSVILSYTLNNVSEIKNKFYEICGYIPPHVTVETWFTFLLRDMVRPYQNYLHKRRVDSIIFVEGRSALYIKKSDTAKYFFQNGKYIYSDKLSEFAVECNNVCGGLVLDRLKNIYHHLYIDEVQDVAGYDLELIEHLMQSSISVTLVGDHRQTTYKTNHSPKNKQYSGAKLVEKFYSWRDNNLCSIEPLNVNHRCNQVICNFADSLYPNFPKATSTNKVVTGHDGVFVIQGDSAAAYVTKYSPQILRYDRGTDCDGYDAMNFGESKGLGFDRILVYPNKKLQQALSTGILDHVAKSAAKIYVGVTRARYSVAFVFDGECKLAGVVKFP